MSNTVAIPISRRLGMVSLQNLEPNFLNDTLSKLFCKRVDSLVVITRKITTIAKISNPNRKNFIQESMIMRVKEEKIVAITMVRIIIVIDKPVLGFGCRICHNNLLKLGCNKVTVSSCAYTESIDINPVCASAGITTEKTGTCVILYLITRYGKTDA